jgi:hypothetical protein
MKWDVGCGHLDSCNCATRGGALVETLDELEYARSACAAAQQGNVEKLTRLFRRNPEILHNDGVNGKLPLQQCLAKTAAEQVHM